jgi:hypothetical protein
MGKRKHVPAFLREVEVDTGDFERCGAILSNWLKCHGYIKDLRPTEHSLEVLRRLMLVECHRERGARKDILTRLHGRYSALRYDVERGELLA